MSVQPAQGSLTIQMTQEQPAHLVLHLRGRPQIPESDEEKRELALSLAKLYFESAQSPDTQHFCLELKQRLAEVAPCAVDLFLEGYSLRVLLLDMKEASPSLPEPYNNGMLELFNVWEVQFFQQFKGSAATEREKIQTAKHLCALYYRAESLMLSVIEDVPTQCLWLKICSRLKQHLVETLPSRFVADEFLTKYINASKVLEVKKLFAEIEDLLFNQANDLNEQLVSGFNAIKAEMIAVQEAINLSTEQTYAQIDALTGRLSQLFVDFGGHMKEMKTIAELLQAQEQTLRSTLNAANRVLDRV